MPFAGVSSGPIEAQNARIGADQFAPAALSAAARDASRRRRERFLRPFSTGMQTRAASFSARRGGERSRSDSDALLEEIVDRLRIGLAARRLHHLADEPADRLRIGLCVADLVRILGDNLVDELFERRDGRSLASIRAFRRSRAGQPPSVQTISNTSLAIFPEIVPSAIRSRIAPSCASFTGEAAMSLPSLLSRPNKFVDDPIGRELRVARLAAHSLRSRPQPPFRRTRQSSRSATSTPAS